MKILHVISSMGLRSGGTSTSVYDLLKGIRAYDVEVLTFELGSNDRLSGNAVNIKFVPIPENKKFLYSKEYKQALLNNRSDLYHIHGLWQYTEYITARIARKQSVPYVVTPHGMLYPEALVKSKLFKKLFLKSFLKQDLEHASCIHVTSKEEMSHIRRLGIKAPIALIPNPIDIPTDKLSQKEKTIFGFIGRLDPIKNLDTLILAWHQLASLTNRSKLIIVGDGSCRTKLQSLVEELQIQNVEFLGFLTGADKKRVLDTLSFVVLPSRSENFGMVVGEALANKIPVIASKGTPWQDLETHNCGWWVDNDTETLSKTIMKALSLSEQEYLDMGRRGRELIINKYSTEIVARQMEQLYAWILSGGNKPEFVYLDNYDIA